MTDDRADRASRRASLGLAKAIRKAGDKGRRVAGFVLPFFDAAPDSGNPTNMWMFNDNRLLIRKPDGTYREIVTTAPGALTSSAALPTEADPAFYSSTYTATWGQSYCPLHGAETGAASAMATPPTTATAKSWSVSTPPRWLPTWPDRSFGASNCPC